MSRQRVLGFPLTKMTKQYKEQKWETLFLVHISKINYFAVVPMEWRFSAASLQYIGCIAL